MIHKDFKVASINDVKLYYIDGEEKKANGKTETWNKGITDYQLNKRNGAYATVAAAVKKSMLAEVANKAAELEKLKPMLIKKYGSRYVDVLWNYDVCIGTPYDMFRYLREKSNPLIEVSHAISQGDDYLHRNTIMLTMYDRKTGDIRFQRFLHFDSRDRVCSISTSMFR